MSFSKEFLRSFRKSTLPKVYHRIDCEQSLFGQSRLSSAGLERANSRERGKRECEASESRGEAGEKEGKEGGTAFSFVTDAFKFLRRPSIGKLDWLINNRMLSARCHCNL